MDVVYFKIEGAPGDYFECPRGYGKMSTKSCAQAHESSQRADTRASGRLANCVSCAIGAVHTNGKAEVSRLRTSHTCVRCGRGSTRLIRGGVCPSCYNREREFLAGANAKGSKPVHARPVLKALTLLVVGDPAPRRFGLVTGAAEAMTVAVRSDAGPVRLAWAKNIRGRVPPKCVDAPPAKKVARRARREKSVLPGWMAAAVQFDWIEMGAGCGV